MEIPEKVKILREHLGEEVETLITADNGTSQYLVGLEDHHIHSPGWAAKVRFVHNGRFEEEWISVESVSIPKDEDKIPVGVMKSKMKTLKPKAMEKIISVLNEMKDKYEYTFLEKCSYYPNLDTKEDLDMITELNRAISVLEKQ